jgi:hypothetical protein
VDHTDGTRITSHPLEISKASTPKGHVEFDEKEKIVMPAKYSIQVEKEGYATVISGIEKDQNKIILPNGTTVVRGTKLVGKTTETFIFIESSDLTIEVDTLGSVTVNNTTLKEPVQFKTLLKMNWIEGSFEMIDNANGKFAMDKMGEFTDVEPETVETTQNSFTSEFSVKNLASGSIYNDKLFTGNIPRFFVLHEDGTGYELLRDEQLIKYFRKKLSDPKTAISEQHIPETDAHSIIVLSPLFMGGYQSNAIGYRQLLRYSPLQPEIRAKIKHQVNEYNTWKQKQDNISRKYVIEQLNNEKLNVSDEKVIEKSQDFVLGSDKNATEEFIIKKYQLR